MTYFTIVKITLSSEMIAIFASFFISAVLFRLLYKQNVHDGYWNSFIMYVAIYKISYVLFNFPFFINTPLSLIYFNGGWKGELLATFGVVIYMYVISRKKQDLIVKKILPLYMLFFLFYEIFTHVFQHHWLAIGLELILLFSYFHYCFKNHSTKLFYILLLLEALLLSFYGGLLLTRNLSILAIGFLFTAIHTIKRRDS